MRNISKRTGDDVAQLYLNFPAVPGAPKIALRGFQRVNLLPGESRSISFTLSPRDLSAVDLDGQRRVFKGDYTVSVGSGQPSAETAHASASFTVDQERAIEE